jgi:hypothetical protein
MGSDEKDINVDHMRHIDRDYRAASGVSGRLNYKIYYSHIHPFPLFVLGENPAGGAEGTDLVASDSLFENWEHDFVHFRSDRTGYPLAGPMCQLLMQILDTRSVDVLRHVPVSNLYFRRSPNMGTLSKSTAAWEAHPFLSRLIEIINPLCILCISNKAYDLFKTHHCRRGTVVECETPRFFTPNGRHKACIFLRARGLVSVLGRETALLMVGHPSKYGTRSEWPLAVAALRSAMQQIGLCPIENRAALVKLPPMPGYGQAI